MPRYFFHICDDDGTIADTEGSELADLESAQREAEKSAMEILLEDIKTRVPLDHRRIEVLTETGETIIVVRLKDLVH